MMYIGTIHGKNTFENDKSQKVLLEITKELKKIKELDNMESIHHSPLDSSINSFAIELKINIAEPNLFLINKKIESVIEKCSGKSILKFEKKHQFELFYNLKNGSKKELFNLIDKLNIKSVEFIEFENINLKLWRDLIVNFSKNNLQVLKDEKVLREIELEEYEYYLLYAKALERKENV